jgi:hypothetical protein
VDSIPDKVSGAWVFKGLVDGLRALTDKQFVEVFYKAVHGRHISSAEHNVFDAHLVLANAGRHRDEATGGRWTVELICPTPDQNWVDDAPICQAGEHCGMPTASGAKQSMCPVCAWAC